MPGNRFYTDFDTACWEGRAHKEADLRNPFQIDRDRILFSHAFRQLQAKTQVFQSGEYDFYRTRLTHTIEVARIARSIAEFLNHTSPELSADFHLDPDLVEAVGLAHDLGHPPFGHIGERKLNDLMADSGGFEGNAQSLSLLVDYLFARPEKPKGMRPTRALLDGVLKYAPTWSEAKAANDERPPKNHFIYDAQAELRGFIWDDPALMPSARTKSIECQIMDWADDTAYSLHDIVDGMRAGFLTIERLEAWAEKQILDAAQQAEIENLLDTMRNGRGELRASMKIGDYIRATALEAQASPLAEKSARHRFTLVVELGVQSICDLHKRIALDLIFQSPPIQQIEFKGGFLLGRLHAALAENYLEPTGRPLRILPPPFATWIEAEEDITRRQRLLCDFLASLTDTHAVRLYQRLYDADFGSIADLV